MAREWCTCCQTSATHGRSFLAPRIARRGCSSLLPDTRPAALPLCGNCVDEHDYDETWHTCLRMESATATLSGVAQAREEGPATQTAPVNSMPSGSKRSRVDATSTSSAAVAATPFPTETVCETTVQLFFSLVDGAEMHTAAVQQQLRVLACSLLKLERTSKALRALLKSNKCLPYYRFFFHTSSATAVLPRRFLDGTFGVALFSGAFGNGPSNTTRFDVLTPKDVLQDRVNTANRLSELSIDRVVTKSVNYMASDLPTGVGPRVAAFVGRARFLTQHRAAANPHWATTCNLANCHCKMLCSDGSMAGGVQQSNPALADLFGESVTSSEEDEDEDENEPPQYPVASYWASLSPKPLTTLPRRVFCSLACSLAYENELSTAVPVRVADAESMETFSSASGKVGLARILASTRAAFKRNDAAARALREAMRSIRKRQRSTIRTELFERMHKNVADVLNIDLGLLYAASALAESPGACQGRLLPATAPGWRDAEIKRFARAIERVKAIYLKHHRESDGLARDERFPPLWLRKVRDQAAGLFPVHV